VFAYVYSLIMIILRDFLLYL